MSDDVKCVYVDSVFDYIMVVVIVCGCCGTVVGWFISFRFDFYVWWDCFSGIDVCFILMEKIVTIGVKSLSSCKELIYSKYCLLEIVMWLVVGLGTIVIW